MEGYSEEKAPARKVVWSGEGPIPDKASAALRNQEIKEKYATDEVLEVREALATIDFLTVKNVFDELYERLGYSPRDMNFFELNAIGGPDEAGFGNAASYSPERNTLGLRVSRILEMATERGIRPELMTTGVLLHEETHAIGRVECHYNNERKGQGLLKTGYRIEIDLPLTEFEKKIYGASEESKFEDFNEGMTEMISHEVLQRYAEQTKHFTHEEVETYVAIQRKIPQFRLVEGFILRLSYAAELPVETVREELKRGYFTDNNFIAGAYREYLEEVLGNEYMQQLETGEVISKKPVKRTFTEQSTRDIKAYFLKLKRKL